MEDLTEHQLDILRKFKENLQDVAQPRYDDRFYCRWLIARNFDLKKAEKMLRDSLAWRKQYHIDTILEWKKPEVIRNYYPDGFFGEAKDGTPVFYFLRGRLDGKGLYYAARKQDLLKLIAKNCTYTMEVLGPMQSKKHGRRIDQKTMICDFGGMGKEFLWKPSLEIEMQVAKEGDSNFPEMLKTVICINLPWIFPIMWNLAKRLISEATRNKVILLGSNWKTEILEYIEADQLPISFGGTAPDPPAVPESDFDVCWGGRIPESYKNVKHELDLSKFTKKTIACGSSHQIDINITTPGSVIEWQYLSRDYDIGFGVYKRTKDKRQKKGEMEEIIKSERVNSQFQTIDGSFKCDDTGTYVLRFDNTYSWRKDKEISYLVEVFEPDANDNEINGT